MARHDGARAEAGRDEGHRHVRQRARARPWRSAASSSRAPEDRDAEGNSDQDHLQREVEEDGTLAGSVEPDGRHEVDGRAGQGREVIAQAIRDVRHAARMILRMPALAAVVVGSLGVGIGANTRRVLVDPGGRVQPDRRRAARRGVSPDRAEDGTRACIPASSWLEYRDLRERLRAMDGLLAFRMIPLYVGERGQRRAGERAARLRQLLLVARPDARARAASSRRRGGQAGAAPVVVISYDYWQTRFAGGADRARADGARQRRRR